MSSARISAQTAGDPPDWLVDLVPFKARIVAKAGSGEITLENGLARRVIRLATNAATVALGNRVSSEHLLRAVPPEGRLRLRQTPVAGRGGFSAPLDAGADLPNIATITREIRLPLEYTRLRGTLFPIFHSADSPSSSIGLDAQSALKDGMPHHAWHAVSEQLPLGATGPLFQGTLTSIG